MSFGIVFVDDSGRVWTAEGTYCAKSHRLLGVLFSRPTFLNPVERRFLDSAPECWPNCCREELNTLLQRAENAERVDT